MMALGDNPHSPVLSSDPSFSLDFHLSSCVSRQAGYPLPRPARPALHAPFATVPHLPRQHWEAVCLPSYTGNAQPGKPQGLKFWWMSRPEPPGECNGMRGPGRVCEKIVLMKDRETSRDRLSRPLKKGHLLRCCKKFKSSRRPTYASALNFFCVSHLTLFERPVQWEFFNSQLGSTGRPMFPWRNHGLDDRVHHCDSCFRKKSAIALLASFPSGR